MTLFFTEILSLTDPVDSFLDHKIFSSHTKTAGSVGTDGNLIRENKKAPVPKGTEARSICGTTLIGLNNISPLKSCTNIHVRWITGRIPVGAYLQLAFGPPS